MCWEILERETVDKRMMSHHLSEEGYKWMIAVDRSF